MALQDEIDRARADIRTDAYPMSIGEWISIYERNELDIHPEFQRFFRWSEAQKSRLIESILLGIPIPPIFVAQRADGVWDVVDGLQRLSTILQFVGVLKDESGDQIPALVLQKTKYLPSLDGVVWQADGDSSTQFDATQRLLLKRSKIDASIILKESDPKAKYELFQRLNTGGSTLSDQEVRNSILVMINRDFYAWIKQLSGLQEFKDCVALTDRAIEEQFDLELVLRFVVFRALSTEELTAIGDMGEFLTDKAIELAQNATFDRATETAAFVATFQALQSTLESDSFKRFDVGKGRFLGGFSVSAYEAVALGLGYHWQNLATIRPGIEEKVKALWQSESFVNNSGSGVRASSRVPRTVPFARELFGG